MNNYNDNSMFIIVTGVIIALSRFLLGMVKTKEDIHILIIMAVVNYIALGFVILFLYNEFCSKIKNKIKNSGLDGNVKQKCNKIIFVISALLIIIYFIFGFLYLIIFKTGGLNDVLSIIALTISIATNGLVNNYSNAIYKIILKIAKKNRNTQKNSPYI